MSRISQGQRVGWRGAQIFPEEYFGTADSGVNAILPSASAQAVAGEITAAGAALTALPSAEATAFPGVMEVAAAAVHDLSGASATSSAGSVTATGTPSIPATFGGGHVRLSNDVSYTARTRIAGAAAVAQAGTAVALGVNRFEIEGAYASAAAGTLRVAVAATVVSITNARTRANAGQMVAVGIDEISDEEILSVLMAA